MAESLTRGARAWCLGAAAACLLPLLTQVPTGLAVAQAAAVAVGALSTRRWPGILRLMALGFFGVLVLAAYGLDIGRDTGCAMLASLLALKPLETYTLREARSLLGFSVFAPFAAFLQDQGPWVTAMAIPAAGLWLCALTVLAEQRPGAPATPFRLRRLREAARITVFALPLALAGFWLFPRLGTPMWGMPENAAALGGLGSRMTPDQWIELFADDRPALRVQFEGPPPPSEQMYWRGDVLWDFDGQSWSGHLHADQRSAPATSDSGAIVRYRVSLEPTDRNYLVVLDLPDGDPETGRLTGDLTVRTAAPVSSLADYRAQSRPGARIVRPLDAAERQAALALPADLNPRMRALARQWRQEAGSDDVAIIRRTLDWIGRDFSYSLSVPPGGRNGVDDFLFTRQLGFCQHFSSAFANLMRASGIPARVVLGYVGGSRNRFADFWVVRRMDAHAWTEVWLEDRGWVRVDPTAAVAPERVLDTVEELARSEALLPESFAPLRDLGDWARRGWNELMLGFDASRQARLLQPLGIDRASSWQLVAAFAVGAGLALGLTLWMLLRGRPVPRDPLLVAWQRYTGRLARAGLAKAPSEPPISFGDRLASALPDQADQVRSLSRRYTVWRYAGRALGPDEKATLIADLLAYRPFPR